MAVICWLRGIYRTTISGVWIDGMVIQGHNGQEDKSGDCFCMTCGKKLWGEEHYSL